MYRLAVKLYINNGVLKIGIEMEKRKTKQNKQKKNRNPVSLRSPRPFTINLRYRYF